MTLRARIALTFVLIVLLVTSVATAVSVVTGSRDVEAGLIETQERAGVTAATNLDFFIATSERSLLATAAVLRLEDLQPTVDQKVVASAVEPLHAFTSVYQTVLLVASRGEVLAAGPDGGAWEGLTLDQNPAFLAAVSAGEPRLWFGTSDTNPVWVVPVPVTSTTDAPMFLAGILNKNRLEELLFQANREGTESILLSPAGSITVATDPQLDLKALVGVRVVDALVRDGASRVVSTVSGTPSSVILTAQALPVHDGHLVLVGSGDRIHALQSRLVRDSAIIAGAIAATGVLLGIYAAQQIARPVAEMRRATELMGRGDRTARTVPRGAREFRELATSFNHMAETLDRDHTALVLFQGGLERLVDARTAQLRDQREDMERFFYAVSHDFKSPSIAIATLAELLEESLTEAEPDHAAILDYVRRIRRSGANLQNLTQEILQFARAEHDAPVLQAFDLRRLAVEVVEELKPFGRQRGAMVWARGLPLGVVSDPERLRHILTNLGQNGLKYMPPDRAGIVQISWRRDAQALILEVHDNGNGIPADLRPHLFRPFARHEQTRLHTTGTGLGLSIVKKHVESLKGSIDLQTEPGRGTMFRVTLPWLEMAGSAAMETAK